MVKQIAKKITCGPMSPIASWAFDYISSREYRYYTKNGKNRAGKSQSKMKLILFAKMLL